MGFFLSKFLWAIFKPSTLIPVFVIVGTLLAFLKKARRLAAFLLCISALSIFILTFTPIPYWLMASLENQIERPETLPEKIDGIIVLAGGLDPYLTQKRLDIHLNSSGDRLIPFVEMVKRYPNAKTVFTGGSGRVFYTGKGEADFVQEYLTINGVPDGRVMLEKKSRNTYENALFSKEMVKPQIDENWILITSAYHMPRSVRVFNHQDWRVIPYPTDYQTDGEYRFRFYYSLTKGLALTETVLKEWVGMIVYSLTGKMTSIFN